MSLEQNLKRENHYVPQWYQKGFSDNGILIQYLELQRQIKLPDGTVKIIEPKPQKKSIKKSFFIKDLYSIILGSYLSDEIETKFFGNIDDKGSRAVRSFIENEPEYIHYRFQDFFKYIDMQKLRTPKGLNWIKSKFTDLDYNQLLIEMQALSRINYTIWTEGVREIVSAKNSDTKFIFTDHPVTTYNYALSPESSQCVYPNDPSISLMATQTIFPLNKDYCLILTNLEYAENPNNIDPLEKRTNPNLFRESFIHTQNMIRERELTEDEVRKINYIIKKRAVNSIAGANKEWLYPEKYVTEEWKELKNIIFPPHTHHFGGEMYIGYDDGTTLYQDAFGRRSPQRDFLVKNIKEADFKSNHYCGCGSGKKYKDCCKNKEKSLRPSWKELSIRERNIIFCNGIVDITGISAGKSWIDVRKELSDDQVSSIYELYDELWPVDTDIISLLPKADKNLRILFSGIVDADTIENLITNLTLYFNEVIVQNPISHPAKLAKEYNPIYNPSKYRQHTLKYIFFILKAFPFIENGSLLLIPNLLDFNKHLYLSSMNMSKERMNRSNIDTNEDKITFKHFEKEYMRSLLSLNDEMAKGILIKPNPKINNEELDELLKEFKQLALNDPLVLLQDNLFQNGGQLQILNFIPTFEISLFLCQITGSILVTNSIVRWKEILEFQYKEFGIATYNFTQFTKFISTFDFTLSLDNDFTYAKQNEQSLLKIREIFEDFYELVLNNESNSNKQIQNLKSKFKKNYPKYQKDIARKYMLNATLNFLIPNGGIVNNNVQRLLAYNGNENYLMNLPAAIFISIQ
jgi:hypothetical protein